MIRAPPWASLRQGGGDGWHHVVVMGDEGGGEVEQRLGHAPDALQILGIVIAEAAARLEAAMMTLVWMSAPRSGSGCWP